MADSYDQMNNTAAEHERRTNSSSESTTTSRSSQDSKNAQKSMDYLKKIDKSLEDLIKLGKEISQSSFRDVESSSKGNKSKSKSSDVKTAKDTKKEQKIRDALGKAAFGDKSKDVISNIKSKITEKSGINLEGSLKDVMDDLMTDAYTNLVIPGLAESIKKYKVSPRLLNVAKSIGGKFTAGTGLDDIISSLQGGTVGEILDNLRSQFDKPSKEDVVDESQSAGKAAEEKDKSSDVKVSQVSASDVKVSQSEGADASNTVSDLVDTVSDVRNISQSAAADVGEVAGNVGEVAGDAATDVLAVGQSAGQAGTAIAGVGEAAAAASPYILAATIALKLLEWAVGPAVDGLKKLGESLLDSANRTTATRKKMLEESKERLKADVETLIKAPFDILKAAANELYDAWDSNIQKINATQGYTKADLQDLMSAYSQRLQEEGLTKYVSSADITKNLASVLDSGLSGVAAEEFAYLATKLSAAVPTQDWFSYADTYATIAANAIKDGKSQSEAIAYANSEIETFASEVLYASRQLSGGFSTGLKDAQSLLSDATKIAQASKTGEPTQIASVLTAVSAITGSIAPDLASSMTDAIVKAATGGNAGEIVALRSLAGINASNTEFLQQFAKNPKKVFSDLFRNLSEMQNMSNDNYMEVAEGLSDVFGISMDAFARIDFSYLADAIDNMSESADSLNENIDLLKAGQTTTTAEQLKMQQINEFMLEEGLSYVLDSEQGRAIQEHMWDEQLALEMQEATYGVELRGAALEFLEGIRETIDNIMLIINPFAIMAKIGNIIQTGAEEFAQESDIKTMLELTKVGNATSDQLYQLTTHGVKLNVTSDLISKLGGVSAYQSTRAQGNILQSIWEPWNADVRSSSLISTVGDKISAAAKSILDSSSSISDVTSKYKWGVVGKSKASSVPSGSSSSNYNYPSITSEAAANHKLSSALDKLVSEDYIKSFVEQNKSYVDWEASAKELGIADLESAVSDAGLTMAELQNQYQKYVASAGAEKSQSIQIEEKDFRDSMLKHMSESVDPKLDSIEKLLSADSKGILSNIYGTLHSGSNTVFSTLNKFMSKWISYVVEHTVYDQSFNGKSKSSYLSEIKAAEKSKSDDIGTQLANILIENAKDLKDPTVQTNVLLSQIVVLLQSLSTKSSTGNTGLSLPDTLSALALGLTNTSR